MAKGAYKTNYTVQHEYYRPAKSKRAAKFKKIKRIFMAAFYLSAITLIISFAESNKFAFAQTVEKEQIIPTLSRAQKDEIAGEYYTGITGSAKIAALIINYSAKNGFKPSLLAALMETESNFNPRAVNKNTNMSIDRGLCQLNNNTFPDLKTYEFFDPETNIKYASEFLKWCIDESDENMVVALAYYNAGIGNVSNENVGDITINYINKILKRMKKHDERLEALYIEKQDLL